jgi:asparagine synthase (glutamine-hydrolysing)
MCGILLVKSREDLPLELHLKALDILKSRGPDRTRYQYTNGIFIAQVVLHITGTSTYYDTEHENFLAYNGEIYDYKTFGSYNNDIEFVDDAVNNNIKKLAQGYGPWAWAWTDGATIRYASDPQGEKTLYEYKDSNTIIVCSEVAPILEYINAEKIAHPYVNKNWGIIDTTPWNGITKITPGVEYINGDLCQSIDSIYNWITRPTIKTMQTACEEFDFVWNKIISQMQPDCDAGLTYSGGLDSSIILDSIDAKSLYAVNCIGKDPIVDDIEKFLTTEEYKRLTVCTLDEKVWRREYIQMLERLCMPAGSWSFVGQWVINKSCKERVLFTGVGADELFGGYDLYRDLEFSRIKSNSPYSKHSSEKLWHSCIEAYCGDYKQATLLMDYWHQITGVDCRGTDFISGAFGIEARNPFLAKPIMQLALNLPFELKVNTVSKPVIRNAFLKRWNQELIYTKKGFTGHANDSFPNFKATSDRMADWKTIAQETFYEGNYI